MRRPTLPASSSAPPPRDPALESLARRVRDLRLRRGWTRRRLAERSGLSERFLARVETGQGNISVVRLASLARALGTSPDRLLLPERNGCIVTLVGLRGAGKSTVGPLLAERLGWPFVEMDSLITEASGLTLDQLFELHGERYYRRLEHGVVRRILERGEPAVVAAAGGVVTERATWGLLQRRSVLVWLRARPEEHWTRVVAQGDRRPMADNPAAMQELRSILAAREATYARARLTIDTSDRSPEEVADELERRLAALL